MQLQAVSQAVKARDLGVHDAQMVYEDTSNATYVLRVYKHTVNGNAHYGAVSIPRHFKGTAARVVVEVDGLDQSDPNMDVATKLANSTSQLAAVAFVMPAFRGRTLRYHEHSWTAGGDFCDAYDGATDDTMALMNVIQAAEPQLDFNGVLVRGISRGGNVALLLGERDSRVKIVASASGPVNFYRQDVADHYGSQYQCQFFTGKTTEQSRERMLASSPVFFPMLPNVQKVFIDQGDVDPIVPLWNGTDINAHLVASGTNVDYHVYPNGTHALLTFTLYWDRLFAALDLLTSPDTCDCK